jgi:lathosterol oxidase
MLDLLRSFSTLEFYLFTLAMNVVIFSTSIIACGWLGRTFADSSLFEETQPVTRFDMMIAGVCVALNAAVGLAGWHLWEAGWIRLSEPSWGRTILDVVVLLLAMDIGMYWAHRIAHHPRLYPLFHNLHHTHDSTNPISLFVLHPFEVVGFGGLLLAVLLVYPVSVYALLIYLTLNIAWGTLGHSGVEPFPPAFAHKFYLNWFGTSTFHAEHHQTPGYNYGFYTLFWDKLFGTLHPRYAEHMTTHRVGKEGGY